MLADEDLSAFAHSNCVLEMSTDGNGLRQFVACDHRQRRVAASPADQLRCALNDSGDRVVDMALDWPVVNQEAVGDSSETIESFVLVDTERLFGEIAAGGDNRTIQFAHQNEVQRRVWKHHAKSRMAGRDMRG